MFNQLSKSQEEEVDFSIENPLNQYQQIHLLSEFSDDLRFILKDAQSVQYELGDY